MKSRTEAVLSRWGAQMNLVAYTCVEWNYKHNSEYNPRYNISSLCDISVNLLRATMLYDAWHEASHQSTKKTLSDVLLCFVL